MNKSRVLLLSAALALGLSLPCLADEVQGVVGSINASNNSITIKDPVNGTSRTVRVHPRVISELKNGTVVKANLKPGSDTADTLQVLLTE